MIENHPSSIMLQDNDGVIVYINKSACDFYGYTSGEIIGMNIADINTFTKNEILFELSEAKRENRNHKSHHLLLSLVLAQHIYQSLLFLEKLEI